MITNDFLSKLDRIYRLNVLEIRKSIEARNLEIYDPAINQILWAAIALFEDTGSMELTNQYLDAKLGRIFSEHKFNE